MVSFRPNLQYHLWEMIPLTLSHVSDHLISISIPLPAMLLSTPLCLLRNNHKNPTSTHSPSCNSYQPNPCNIWSKQAFLKQLQTPEISNGAIWKTTSPWPNKCSWGKLQISVIMLQCWRQSFQSVELGECHPQSNKAKTSTSPWKKGALVS